jgi:hypothetical protein
MKKFPKRIFKSIGLTGSNAGLISTGIYGIVRLVAISITMYWIVDKFGRTKLLIGGSALAVSEKKNLAKFQRYFVLTEVIGCCYVVHWRYRQV